MTHTKGNPVQPVTGQPFLTKCYRCKRRLNTGQETVYADHDGPAFEAYYCEKCHREHCDECKG